ncbi:DNA (cytosine-5-)-methyltransferase [Stenotrophomonas sp. GD03930]|jgi:DNA (cytosine-5)-methyltransferase 1|uniref:DNA cytosine methyltransferase n=1 Tax=Stenotrophomonas sp. GD03930 TaxID=2975406 RepID=UPI00244A3EBE|nr:DNA (cytosine-5-)-methyltransferase [Stenotrophomonas sp. GD03930]MDH1231569.1 DNA (cytosine-5-)-methyltransferase [Stenotrophomonas sp. GD03930]
MHIPVVDIFAGPGGLGEGFSAYTPSRSSKSRPFKIAISAEMEVNAAKTLRLRAFYRQFAPHKVPDSYYDYVAGRGDRPWTEATKTEWENACHEARQLKLGDSEDDKVLHARIREVASQEDPWVLIGGPPCQAYSLVGRARNRGVVGYKAEEDPRHFLYQHYLKIIKKYSPAAFVMENVKGILSSKVGGELMFPRILADLRAPGGRNGPRYRIIPLVEDQSGLFDDDDGRRYILKAEELGVPQARHRVVLFGVREDVDVSSLRQIRRAPTKYSVGEVIGGMPHLRSGITNVDFENWPDAAREILLRAAQLSDDAQVSAELRTQAKLVPALDAGAGGRARPWTRTVDEVPEHLKPWLLDERLGYILNHEVRPHMWMDLIRYGYASAFTKVYGRSPRGSGEFPEAMHPDHENWTSGKFVDRFKVQRRDESSSTVTSHLQKDGHYFIHPDPTQLRSLSVREAARLQTFPDNYFFEGSRGAQFRQVGNAVPPWMAKQIADVVYSTLVR